MIEIPEAVNLSSQAATHLIGKTVARVVAGASPHKFAWFYGDPAGNAEMAEGLTVSGAPIEKASYMGGSVYFCPGCQPV